VKRLAPAVLTSIVAPVRNAGDNYVDWRVTVPTALAAAVVAWFVTDWLKPVRMIVAGVHMLWAGR